ncbi:MAG: hypothetical protein OXG46_02485 [Chloroflexi bacterium]|nr:hypothetical protein [Chloroflexota bacterium]MCY3938360.1 hypothetical protein [Chloroflexota bacterium]
MLDAPVATTLMARSAFPETHPLSVGVATEIHGSAYLSGDYAAVAADPGAYSDKVSDPG